LLFEDTAELVGVATTNSLRAIAQRGNLSGMLFMKLVVQFVDLGSGLV
jgi:hypothetical protein